MAAACSDLWQSLDLSGKQQAGKLLDQAVSSPQYQLHLQHLKLEFSANIEDHHLDMLSKFRLQTLNLNGCHE